MQIMQSSLQSPDRTALDVRQLDQTLLCMQGESESEGKSNDGGRSMLASQSLDG
jgi:hypothetical protein